MGRRKRVLWLFGWPVGATPVLLAAGLVGCALDRGAAGRGAEIEPERGSAEPAEGAPRGRERALRVMPMGDSITIGYGGVAGYRLPLWMYFDEKQQPIDLVGAYTNGTPEGTPDPDHQGRSGWRIGDFVEFDGDEKDPPSTIEAILLRQRPDVVLLHAGTNDIWDLERWQRAPDDLAALLDRAHAAAPEVAFVVAKLLPTIEPRANLGIDWLNHRYHAVVHERRGRGWPLQLVDMQEACPTLTTKDGVHPDFPCYLRMTQAWIGALLELDAPIPPPERPFEAHSVERAFTTTPSEGPLESAVGGEDLRDDLHPHELADGPLRGWCSRPLRVALEGAREDAAARLVGELPRLEFSFGAPVDVDRVEFWNGSVTRRDGFWVPRRSIRELQLWTRDTGGDWTERGLWTLLEAGPRPWSPPETREVTWRAVEAVRLEIRSVYARIPEGVRQLDLRVALSEIRFGQARPPKGPSPPPSASNALSDR